MNSAVVRGAGHTPVQESKGKYPKYLAFSSVIITTGLSVSFKWKPNSQANMQNVAIIKT